MLGFGQQSSAKSLNWISRLLLTSFWLQSEALNFNQNLNVASWVLGSIPVLRAVNNLNVACWILGSIPVWRAVNKT